VPSRPGRPARSDLNLPSAPPRLRRSLTRTAPFPCRSLQDLGRPGAFFRHFLQDLLPGLRAPAPRNASASVSEPTSRNSAGMPTVHRRGVPRKLSRKMNSRSLIFLMLFGIGTSRIFAGRFPAPLLFPRIQSSFQNGGDGARAPAHFTRQRTGARTIGLLLGPAGPSSVSAVFAALHLSEGRWRISPLRWRSSSRAAAWNGGPTILLGPLENAPSPRIPGPRSCGCSPLMICAPRLAFHHPFFNSASIGRHRCPTGGEPASSNKSGRFAFRRPEFRTAGAHILPWGLSKVWPAHPRDGGR